ncbi:hypothetical protein QVD17_18227 [Tagetes erecta]|uniref:Uncharacterized protein n=1 Tax=Tagetes erecta TaxID=13708 RepID=A0AAD8KMD7_TARER|nr:hypothetical protein QVD17_18227 [Tagetes erecta]
MSHFPTPNTDKPFFTEQSLSISPSFYKKSKNRVQAITNLCFFSDEFVSGCALDLCFDAIVVIHSNVSTPKGQGFVFSKLGFAIQKGCDATCCRFTCHLGVNCLEAGNFE